MRWLSVHKSKPVKKKKKNERKKKASYLKGKIERKHINTGVLLVTMRALCGYGHCCASRRKASNWGWRRRLKVQRIMPAAAQIAWLVRVLMRFLIRGLYSPDFGNITELIKMIGMEKVGCQ